MENFLLNFKNKILLSCAIIFALSVGGYFLNKFGYNEGVAVTQAQLELEKEKWQQQIEKVKSELTAKNDEITKKYSKDKATLEEQIVTLKKHPKIITKYIKEQENLKLPSGFVLYHNRLVTNESVSKMVDIDNKDYCNLTLYDLSDALSVNYTRCNECMTKLSALQKIVKEYIEKQNKLIDEKTK